MSRAGLAESRVRALQPYAVEPLALPPQWLAPSAVELAHLDARPPAPWPAVVERRSAERLYWFRWITGHQVSFLAWQLLAAGLHDALHASQARRVAAAGRIAVFTRCYSAMLVYSSSCPRIVYHEFIRPRMVRQHPAFSGTWARDYRAVALYLRGRNPYASLPEAGGWARDRAANVTVHEAVAAKLVPDGRSLLRAAHDDPQLRRLPGATACLLYDDLFQIERADVAFGDLITGLARRIAACAADLAVNELFPPSVAEPRRELTEFLAPDVVSIIDDLPAVLSETIAAACSLVE